MSFWRALWPALLLCAASTQADDGYLGAAACAACHAEQSTSQQLAGHARSLSRPLDHPLADRLAGPAELQRDGRFSFSIQRADDVLEVVAAGTDESTRLIVDWAFGAGDQAVTLVSRIDEDWYIEHHWSYYASADDYAVTPGHQGVVADDLGQALGVRYRTFSPRAEIFTCFRCHSTGPLSLGDQFQIQPSELGVRCESCHGPGARHVAAVSSGDTEAARRAIENPGRLEPDALLARCGQCHRPPAEQPSEVDYRDPWNVRHQPLYMTRSRCFTDSVKLTCMTCHDPHQNVVRNDAASYRTLCLDCHTEPQTQPAPTCGEPARADCVSCHMPKVRPHEHLSFTNHWIGVFEGGEALVPRR